MSRPVFDPGPAASYKHDHPEIRDPLAAHDKAVGLGQRVADAVAAAVGSWPFIIIQSVLLAGWITMNVWLAIAVAQHRAAHQPFDPYPFILLNLVLSFQAAYTGPVVMMSQNRQNEKDRLTAHNDYVINQKAEEEIKVILDHLVHQDHMLIAIMEQLAKVGTVEGQETIRGALDDLRAADQRVLGGLAEHEDG
ncbi:MAG: DUF1003 domain-containing protein [Armatimonadetes bacterium]|nr:DUF1003 domain-containing protein [Armatimonadota bacterium]